MKVLLYAVRVLVFIVLTILTQIGGVVYLLSFLFHPFIYKKINNRYVRFAVKSGCFWMMYLCFTFLVVPLLAKPLGRVALPLTTTHHIRPLNVLTCLLNRHYVRPALKEAAEQVAVQMEQAYPGTVVNYLDASFPFFNGFPLLPHLSHKDGKKLDLAFYYLYGSQQTPVNEAPSFIGYGVQEGPRAGEVNTAAFCEQKGYWQYGWLEKVVPQGRKKDFTFDSVRTRYVVQAFIGQAAIGKIFIEPHLKTRLQLTSSKIRFHGCQAVRHDDHIHVQLQ